MTTFDQISFSSTAVNRPLISIFISNYAVELLSTCLDDIFSQIWISNFEVIICDDHTEDGSWDIANDYMRRYPDCITLSRSQAPFGSKWHEGKIVLQMVRGEYYVVLANNRKFDPEYVRQTIDRLASDLLFIHTYIGKTKEKEYSSTHYKTSSEIKSSENPLVSICVYNYEYGRYLRQCLESIKEQTYDNIEICFSDNGSTDNSWGIAMDFSSLYAKKMSLTRNRKNFGAACNQDNTMYDAQGKYILFLCSDDAMKPGFIERCVTLLERFPDAAFVMVHRDIIDEKNDVKIELPFYDQTCLIPGDEQTAIYMMSSVNPSISQVLYMRDKLNEGNRNSMRLSLNSRWFGARISDFNLCCDYSMIYINEPLLLNRVHSMSEGSLIAENILQCVSEYSLVHQFAEKATSMGRIKAAGRLEDAVKKIGKLCLRYCARFLLQKDDDVARRYLRLAEAFYPSVIEEELFQKLSRYFESPDAEVKKNVIEFICLQANLVTRAVSYPIPPGSIPC